jgi:predicted GH43/DUF377 family glycosyl hydrolase
MHSELFRRTSHRLSPDPRRVIAKPYLPGEELAPGGTNRSSLLMQRILDIPEGDVAALLQDVLAKFRLRHRDFEATLDRNFDAVAHHLGADAPAPSKERRSLIGAYYTHEYSVEGAALFNPSLVVAPDQSGIAPGSTRLIMSLRAVGEGHISSIEFRTLVVSSENAITFEPQGDVLVTGQRTPPERYNKLLFGIKLGELGVGNDLARAVLSKLGSGFSLSELENVLEVLSQSHPPDAMTFETIKVIRLLAASNYVTTFPETSTLSERVIFPAGPHETRGMEDARFVRFVEPDGEARYFATYTAYDGFGILPQLIETSDFRSFAISTLNGSAAQNKGMALFPRRVNGKFVMLSRKDRENLYLAQSEDSHFWHDAEKLDTPHNPWELVQIGNCGSPIETEAGWLVITHGVGPMRRYVLGAILLDLDNPLRVIGRMKTPLLEPNESERDGYVPNVVYSCGAFHHGADLIVPYGLSDGAIGIGLASVSGILAAIEPS